MPRIELPQRSLHLEYELHGAAGRPAVVLVMGLGMQLIAWPQALIERITSAGFRVLVFDNRDIGLSGAGPLGDYTPPPQAMLRYLLHLSFVPAYTLGDLAADTLALADALSLGRFHLAGVSLGGMIAQTLAARAPDRVASLVSIMSNAGARTAPWPRPRVLMKFLNRPPSSASFEQKLEHFFGLMKLLGELDDRTDATEIAALRERMSRGLERAYRPEGTTRQFIASLVESDRSRELAKITCPTLILHGRNDPLVPLPAAHRLQRAIPHAQLEVIDRLGHYLPQWAAPVLGERIARFAAGARAPSPS